MNRSIVAALLAAAALAGGCKKGENLKASIYDCPCLCVDCATTSSTTCTGTAVEEDAKVCAASYAEAEVACSAACDQLEGSAGIEPCFGDCEGSVTPVPLAQCELDVGPQEAQKNACTPPAASSAALFSSLTTSSPAGLLSAPPITAATASIVAESSSASLSVDGDTGTFRPVGRIVLSMALCGKPTCPVRIEGFSMGAQGSFGLGKRTVSGFGLTSRGEFPAVVSETGVLAADVGLMPRSDARGTVGSDYYSRSGSPTSFGGTLDPRTGKLHVNGRVTMDDGSSTWSLDAVVTDSAPLVVIEGTARAECGIAVTFSAGKSVDPDGDTIVRFEWFEQDGTGHRAPLGTGPQLSLPLPVGRHLLGVRAFDARGRFGEAFYGVVSADTLPPVIDSAAAGQACLWPPNHDPVAVVVGSPQLTGVHDACDGTPVVRFTAAASSQPDGIDGPDAAVTPAGDGVCLLAERLGTDSQGRVYTLTLEARDGAGHVATGTTHVTVVHDQRPSTACPLIPESALAPEGDARCPVTKEVSP